MRSSGRPVSGKFNSSFEPPVQELHKALKHQALQAYTSQIDVVASLTALHMPLQIQEPSSSVNLSLKSVVAQNTCTWGLSYSVRKA